MPAPDNLVSVIMPVRDGERFVGATIASVLAQTHRALELIAVDDGSSDGTPAILAAAVARDPRVRILRGEHAGVAAARNRAIADARGELIAPVDADDLWHPTKLERQVAEFTRAGDRVGVVYCWSLGIDENDFVVEQGQCESNARGQVFETLIESNFLGNASTPMFRRACVVKVGGYDPSLHAARAQGAEDWKLYLALAESCEFAVVPEYLVAYRRTPTSMSTDTRAMERSMTMVGDWVASRAPALAAAHRRRRDWFTQCYLADQALGRNRVGAALMHQLRAYAARPARLVHPSAIEDFVRLLARSAGLRRPVWTKPTKRQLVPLPGAGEAWIPARSTPRWEDAAAVGRDGFTR